MTDKRKPIIKSSDGGWFRGISDHLRLVWRLWNDQRISPLLKLFPIGSLIYLIFPFDIPGPLDDAGVLWFLTYMFVELSPPDIVDEHRAEIQKTVIGKWREAQDEVEINEADIIDAEFEDQEPTE